MEKRRENGVNGKMACGILWTLTKHRLSIAIYTINSKKDP